MSNDGLLEDVANRNARHGWTWGEGKERPFPTQATINHERKKTRNKAAEDAQETTRICHREVECSFSFPTYERTL